MLSRIIRKGARTFGGAYASTTSRATKASQKHNTVLGTIIGARASKRHYYNSVLDITDTLASAQMARLKGDANGCETAIKEAYAIGRQIFGDQLEGQDVFMDLNIELGLLALMRGHLKQAVRYLENAHALSQLIVGNKTPVVAQILVPLGSVLSTMGYYEEGMSYLQEGLDILEQSSMGSVTSHESPRAELDEVFSAIISNLAGQGLYEECHKKFQDYVRRYHLKFTRDLGLARLHNNWALVLEKIDRPGEAKMLHLEALAIREEISGASSLIVASSCANLGRLCGKLGEFEDGIAYLDRASTIISNSSGQLKDHPIALDLLAAKVTFLDAAGDSRKSTVACRELMDRLEAAVIPANERARLLCIIGKHFSADPDRTDLAEEQYKNAIQIYGTLYDDAPIKEPCKMPFVDALLGLAAVYHTSGQAELAVELESAAEAIRTAPPQDLADLHNESQQEAVKQEEAPAPKPDKAKNDKKHLLWFLE